MEPAFQRMATTHSRAIMKKNPFTRFFPQKPVRSAQISLSLERPSAPHLFFSGFRCPSDQLQIVALRLSFIQPDTAAFPARFR
jgi:hypothetical protein